MPKVAKKVAISKNGHRAKPEVSELGKKLRQISDKIAASGEKVLNRHELEREIENIRFGG